MKKRTKRLLAMLLASAMILQQGSTMGVLATESETMTEIVSETQMAAPETQVETAAPETKAPETQTETSAPETKAPETSAPETKTPETAAPETQAPETSAPETQVPETKAPETQAAGTQTSAPETQASEAPETQVTEKATEQTAETITEQPSEAETQTVTEEQTTEAEETQATEETAGTTETSAAAESETTTEAATEKVTESAPETETEAPKTNFTYEDKHVKITAVAEEAANLPQDAQIHADLMQPGTPEYQAAAAALEAAYAGQDVVLDYVFYDIYFTAESAGEGRIEPEAGTVAVSMQFKQPELAADEDVEVQSYDVVHVEDGKAQEVPSTVQTTGDGSVASVGFTSGDFSPYAVVMSAEEQDEVATIGLGEEYGIMPIDEPSSGTSLKDIVGTKGSIKETVTSNLEGLDRNGTLKVHVEYSIDDDAVAKAAESIPWVYDLSSLINDPDSVVSSITGGGSIMSGGSECGYYEIKDGKVYFYPDLNFFYTDTEHTKTKTDVGGDFDFSLQFDQEKVGTKDSVDFQFPGGLDVKVTFKDLSHNHWKDLKGPIKGDDGNYRLDYTVSFVPGANLDSLTLEDIMSGGQELDINSIKIKSGNDYFGTIPSEAVKYDKASGKLTVDLAKVAEANDTSIKAGVTYSVEYSAILDEDDFGKEQKNSAVWKWNGENTVGPDEKTITPKKKIDVVKRYADGSPKEGSDAETGETWEEYEYVIEIGDGETDLTGLTVEDFMTNNQKLVGDIHIEPSVDGKDTLDSLIKYEEGYTFDNNEKKLFSFKFNEPGPHNEKYTITYKTTTRGVTGLLGNSYVKNRTTVEDEKHKGENSTNDEHNFGTVKPDAVVKKTFSKFEDTDLIYWNVEVDINEDNAPYKDVVVKEESFKYGFPGSVDESDEDRHWSEHGKTLTILWDNIVVTKRDGTIIDPSMYVVNAEGHTITFTTLSEDVIIIIVTKSPDGFKDGSGKPFDAYNEVSLTVDGKEEGKAHDYATKEDTDISINKSGSYDPATKLFSWTVVINELGKEFEDEIPLYFADDLPEGHEFVGADANESHKGKIYVMLNYWPEGYFDVKLSNVAGRQKIEPVYIGGPYSNGKTYTLSGNKVTIKYITKLTAQEEKELGYDQKTYHNTAYLTDAEGETIASGGADVERTVHYVEKKDLGTTVANGDILQYEVIINADGLDLNPGNDTLTLIDELQEGVELVRNSVKVLDAENNPISSAHVSYAQRKLKVVVPDGQKVIVHFSVQIEEKGNQTIKNNVTLWGQKQYDAQVEQTHYVDEHSSSIHGKQNSIYLFKFDEDNLEALLSGAEFELYKYDVTDGVLSNETKVGVYSSDDEGKVPFESLTPNVLYMWKESKAPTGYEKDGTEQYFVMYSEGTSNNREIAEKIAEAVEEKNSEINVSVVRDGYAWMVSNKKITTQPIEEHLAIKKAADVGVSKEIPSIFEFTVEAVNPTDAPLPEEETVTNEGTDVTFGDMTYSEAGDYIYEIKETGFAKDKGTAEWTLNTDAKIYAKVSITDEDGVLTSDVKYYSTYAEGELSGEIEGDPTITNTHNKPNSITAALQFKKTVAGEYEGTIPNSFEFEVAAVDPSNAPLPDERIVKNTEGNVQFGDMLYEAAGTYEYKITEKGFVEGAETTGWTTSDAIIYAKVVVKEQATESEYKLVVESVKYYSDKDCKSELSDPAIENEYTKPGTAAERLEIKKAASGTGAPEAIPNIFTFTLSAVTEKAPMPTTDTSVTNNGESVRFGLISFDADSYTARDDHTYIYKIMETAVAAGNTEWTIPEDHVIYAKVVLTETGGNITADVTYHKDASCTTSAIDDPTITNIYTQPKGSLSITKAVTNEPADGTNTQDVSYEVTVSALDEGIDLSAVTVKVNNVVRNSERTADSIKFAIKKDETAVIEELPLGRYKVAENVDGKTFTATYGVTGDSEETSTAPTIALTVADKDAEVTITNTYTEQQKDASGSMNLKATKSMAKKDSDEDLTQFKFKLEWAGEDDAPEDQDLPVEKNADADGSIDFGELTFNYDDYEAYTEDGKTFIYKVSETVGTDKTVLYSEDVYTVEVTFGELDETTNTFDVEYTLKKNGEDYTGVIEFINDTTTVKVDKVDEAGHKLAGAKLQITVKDEATGKPVDFWTTDDKTHEITGKLETGKTYVLKETEALTGYAVSAPIEFAVDENGDIMVDGKKVDGNLLTMTDAKLHFNVNKTELGTGDEVEGAELEVLDKDGKVVDSWTSKKGETHDFGGKLKAGEKYTLREKVAPNGYTYVSDIEFTVEKDGKITTTMPKAKDAAGNDIYLVEDSRTSVKVSKVDVADGKELAGAHIQILDSKGNVVEEWTSTTTPHEVKGLKTGETYTMRETVAPDGYAVTTDTTFTLKADGTIDTGKTTTTVGEDGRLLVEDNLTSVKVSKVDVADGKELAGAHIQILDSKGNVVEEWTSTTTPHEVKGLKTGETYTMRETVAPDGYAVTTDTTFTLKADGTVDTGKTTAHTKDGTLLVEDNLTSVKVSKVDVTTGAELEGATIQILDENGNVVEEWTSTTTPHEVKGLKTGKTYTLRETVAPNGYTVTTDTTFTLNADGTVDAGRTTAHSKDGALLVEDSLNAVSVQKVDETGAALKGAKLVVKNADGVAVESWTSDGTAHSISGIAKGRYTLSEVEAPEGYQVSADVPFEITGKEPVGTVISLTMTDKKVPESSKYSLTVTKHLRLDNIASDLGVREATYYVALFSDEARTQRVSNVKKIEFKNATTSSVVFNNLGAGTYYVGETDENGTLLVSKVVNDKLIFYPEYGDKAMVTLGGKKSESGNAEFTNVYVELPSGFYLAGQLTVTKKLLVGGEEASSDDTYYARVFSDKAMTRPASDVLALSLGGNSTASVTVTDLPIGETLDSSAKYYVAETDEDGKPLDPDDITEFSISIDKSEVVLSSSNSQQEVVITNDFAAEEEEESESETEVNGEKTAPKTGDDTNYMLYLLMMAAAAGSFAAALGQKRRRNRTEQ